MVCLSSLTLSGIAALCGRMAVRFPHRGGQSLSEFGRPPALRGLTQIPFSCQLGSFGVILLGVAVTDLISQIGKKESYCLQVFKEMEYLRMHSQCPLFTTILLQI